ncbi:MAG: polysaccharide biosynthesis C-terminal domain-containing protein [Sphingomonadales bacterium]
MAHDKRPPRPGADTGAVARGAGMAFLGRMGALIEPVSVLIFATLYGAPTLGLFLLLWGYVQLAAVGSDYAMTTTLQRFVPSTTDEDRIHGIVKLALLLSTGVSILFAAALTLAAPVLAGFINAEEGVTGQIETIIRIYAWAVPLWVLIEVTTAAVRARRAFGPEVRVRIFYEQGLRLVLGVAFFLIGFTIYGLFMAHLAALAMAGYLSLRLLARHYEIARLFRASLSGPMLREMLAYASPMAASNIIKRLQINLPLYVLNLILPGAAGATAVAIYAIARKVVSMLHVIRQSFEYVVAPMASATRAGSEDRARTDHTLGEMYAFSTRMICALFIPAAATVIMIRRDIVGVIGPEYAGAGTLIAILAMGRAMEAATGPSTAMVEMLGRYRLPLLNGLLGLMVATGLLIWLAPAMGPPGAAVAASVGINVTALAGLLQIWRIYGLQPYDRRIIRPVVVAGAGALLVIGIVVLLTPLGSGARFAGALGGLVLALILLIRYGLGSRDASTFGRIGRWLRH